jgi:hypothetical protein
MLISFGGATEKRPRTVSMMTPVNSPICAGANPFPSENHTHATVCRCRRNTRKLTSRPLLCGALLTAASQPVAEVVHHSAHTCEQVIHPCLQRYWLRE